MKIFIMLAANFLIYGCNTGISEKQKGSIETAVLMHNNTYGLKYKMDSINNVAALQASSAWMGKERSKAFVDSSIKETYEHANKKYTPHEDPRLTYEKFVTWCKEMKFDPVEYAQTFK
jgi:hypothetical protein